MLCVVLIIRLSYFSIQYSVFSIHYSVFSIHYSVFTIHYSVYNLKNIAYYFITMTTWYELEILLLNSSTTPSKPSFYPLALYNRSDANAGFDLHTSENVHVSQVPGFIPFGIAARLLKVEQMPNGLSNECVKTDSHFMLIPRSSIYKTG